MYICIYVYMYICICICNIYMYMCLYVFARTLPPQSTLRLESAWEVYYYTDNADVYIGGAA